uniref:Calmodulin binding transcription activator 1 n=1 Tax=Seriola lalandi dorsalis TaxID=1841481 RepID=A0A3B4XKC4_SERLL
MRNFSSLPTHPSFIFLYLHPLSSPTSPSAPDEPGQLKIYLPKKLLECLPKCSSLPKERHRWNTNEVRMKHTQKGNICDSEMKCYFYW